MKNVLAIIALLAMSSISADVFESTQEFTSYSNNSSYEFKSQIEINILKVNVFAKTAVIEVNGEVKEFKLNVTSEYQYDHELYASYTLVIANDILASGHGCEEAESVFYFAKFDAQVALYNTNLFEVSNVAVSAYQKYSYDVCHDFSPKSVNFEYLKK